MWELPHLDVERLGVQAFDDIAYATPGVQPSTQRCDLGRVLTELEETEGGGKESALPDCLGARYTPRTLATRRLG
jgi:hypothetical protein